MMAVGEHIAVVPIPRPPCFEVVRRHPGVGATQVVGFVTYEPWADSYCLRTADGRIVKAGLDLGAAQEWAVTEVTW